MFNASIRQLRYLIALADTQSFSRAAERMNVTQSTLSVAIQSIEHAMGAELVDRTGRTIQLTAAGEVIVSRLRGLLSDIDELPNHAAEAAQPLSTRLRFGVIPSVAPFILPKALPSLRLAYPKLRLSVREGLTRTLLDELRNGQLDAALIATPYRFEGLDHVVLSDDPFALAVAENHRLANRDVIDVHDLEGERLLLLEPGHCLREHVIAAVGIEAGDDGDVRTASLVTLMQLVENGMGVTFLPRIAVEAGLLRGAHVRLVSCHGNRSMTRTLVLVWRARAARSGDYTLLATHLRDHCMPPQSDWSDPDRDRSEPRRRT
jgi:LysR family hydrogen peroxide-inducible transcriptional activator